MFMTPFLIWYVSLMILCHVFTLCVDWSGYYTSIALPYAIIGWRILPLQAKMELGDDFQAGEIQLCCKVEMETCTFYTFCRLHHSLEATCWCMVVGLVEILENQQRKTERHQYVLHGRRGIANQCEDDSPRRAARRRQFCPAVWSARIRCDRHPRLLGMCGVGVCVVRKTRFLLYNDKKSNLPHGWDPSC